MPFVIDRIKTDKLSVNGLQIQKPKDPRDYILSKEKYDEVVSSLDKGEFILNNNYFNFPEDELYVLAGVETYLKFQEAQVNIEPSLIQNKKVNVNSSIETYLKFWEATSSNVNYNYTNKTGFQQQLLELINDTTYFGEVNLQTKTEFINRLLDKGVVEFGQIGDTSKLVYSEILKKLTLSIEEVLKIFEYGDLDNAAILRYFFDVILDKGIVVRTYKENLIISSVETYLKFAEGENNLGNPAVPA
jgi:hypothetical protein